MSKTIDVYGIGNAIMDIQVQADDSVLQRHDLKKGGMQLVDAEHQLSLLADITESDPHHASGGSAANSVIAIAQLGGKTAYGCLIGDDVIGQDYQQQMEQKGVMLHNKLVKDETTGTCVIIVTPDAERTMNTCLAVSASFGPEHLCEEMIAAAQWLYVEGYLFSSPTGQEAAKKAVEIAKKSGTKVAVTFSDTFIVEVFGEPLNQVLANVDLIFANKSEAQAFAKTEDADTAFKALCEVSENVIMTLHDKGVRCRFEGKEFQTDAFSVKAIDSTGAGDMFAGAFLYGITNGLSAEDSSRLACFLASRIVSQMGPRIEGDLAQFPELKGLVKAA